MTPITIMLSWPPAELSPNARTSRHASAAVAKAYKLEAYYAALQALGPNNWKFGERHRLTRVKIRYTFAPPDARVRDDDNHISRMKWARDGIAKALGVDDRIFSTQPVEWARPVRGGSVTVEIRTA